METQPIPTKQAKVVFPLHGIRTRGEWVRTAADTLSERFQSDKDGWICRLDGWSYGRFNLIQFLTPWSRSAKVEWFRGQYEKEMADRQLPVDERANLYPSVVAHSFGTYILGNALLKYKDIKFNKIILVGSILPSDFPWEALMKRGQVRAVRNEYGVDDIWTVCSSWIIQGTGASGTNGFNPVHFPKDDSRFEQEEFLYKHSDYFVKRHIRSNWRPFLEMDVSLQVLESELNVKRPRSDHPLSQLLAAWILGVACLLVCGGTGYGVYRHFNPSPPTKAIVFDGNDFERDYFTARRNSKLDELNRRLSNGSTISEQAPLRIEIPEPPSQLVREILGVMIQNEGESSEVLVSFIEAQNLREFRWLEVSGGVSLDSKRNPTITNTKIHSRMLRTDGCKTIQAIRNDKLYAESLGLGMTTREPFTWVNWRCRVLYKDSSARGMLSFVCPVSETDENCLVPSNENEPGPIICTDVNEAQRQNVNANDVIEIVGRISRFDDVNVTLEKVELKQAKMSIPD